MQSRVIVGLLLLGLLLTARWSELLGGAADKAAKKAKEPTMILVKNPLYSEKKPLRFDSGHAEDNSSCMVCHVDFQEELISATHQDEGITCMACHGDSLNHSDDEFNITRPDVIWGRAEIEPFCKQCHPKHKKPEEVKKFHAKWLGKRRKNGRLVMEDSTCTDCHGQHAILVGEGDFK